MSDPEQPDWFNAIMDKEEARAKINDWIDRMHDDPSATEGLDQFLNDSGISEKEAVAIFRENSEEAKEQMRKLREGIAKLQAKKDDCTRKLRGLNDMESIRESFQRIKDMGAKEAIESIEAKYPKMFAAAYPRRFEMPAGFSNPKRFAIPAFWVMHEWCEMKSQETHLESRDQHSNKVVCAMIEKQVPTYFVSAAIMHALINTDLPKDFSLVDMPWPLDAMLFVIPDGTLESEHGNITLLGVAKCTQRRYPNDWMNWENIDDETVKFETSHDGPDAACILAMTDSGHVFQWQCPIDATSIDDAASVSVQEGELGNLGRGVSKPVEYQEEQFSSSNLPRAAFQIILAMLACPEMIEAGVIVRHPSTKKGKVKQAIWAPNFFGKAYRRYDQILGENDEHGHKRTHWRRGHFRHQRFGAGFAAIKVLWIQPVLVGKNRMLQTV